MPGVRHHRAFSILASELALTAAGKHHAATCKERGTGTG
jgi:hypothetical protein